MTDKSIKRNKMITYNENDFPNEIMIFVVLLVEQLNEKMYDIQYNFSIIIYNFLNVSR